jgi:hypothetical protein
MTSVGSVNDVLVSSTLRDLVIGSGLEFEDRGPHELKGVPGEWRLFAITSPCGGFGETQLRPPSALVHAIEAAKAFGAGEEW